MDDRSFDAISRALGGGASRRAALAALLGLGAIAGAAPIDAKRRRRRKRCNPRCPEGQTCRKGQCACDDGGSVCGGACCIPGQSCEGGQCVGCLALREPCTETALPCCPGLTCTRGQGGPDDIACLSPAGGACETGADCESESDCVAGVCTARDVPAWGCTVCAYGCPHTTIEAAIAAASPGAVVTVAPGTYAPAATAQGRDEYALKITTSLTLATCGYEGRATIVCPREISRGLDCILVRNATVTLERLDLVGPGSDTETRGIVVQTSQMAFPPPQGPAFARILDSSVRGVRTGFYSDAARVFIEDGLGISNIVYGLDVDSLSTVTCTQPVDFYGAVGQRCRGSASTVWGCGC